jgi:hypothetical protein
MIPRMWPSGYEIWAIWDRRLSGELPVKCLGATIRFYEVGL